MNVEHSRFQYLKSLCNSQLLGFKSIKCPHNLKKADSQLFMRLPLPQRA